jgi:hypothetical protein
MKSLIHAINNLASSIASLANSISNKDQTSVKEEKSTFIGKTPKNPYPKNPYMDIKDNIDFSYNTYGSLNFNEREALYKIYKAIFNKGVNEPLHDKMLANLLNDLKRDWPSLHTAINSLVQSKTKNFNNIDDNKHYH